VLHIPRDPHLVGELKKAAVDCTGKIGSSRMAIDKLVAHIMSL
jgi:hypothetical protein